MKYRYHVIDYLGHRSEPLGSMRAARSYALDKCREKHTPMFVYRYDEKDPHARGCIVGHAEYAGWIDETKFYKED